MAGTLTISTLSDGTNSTSTTNLTKGPCVAWVNFNGTGTPAIRSSYNVSSITRNGTGDYTINFTNALANANFVLAGTCNLDSSGNYNRKINYPFAVTPVASSARIFTTLDGSAGSDCAFVNCMMTCS